MATVQFSQRPFLVLAVAIVLHVGLISAQVTTRTGNTMLQVATFGLFAEIQRVTMVTVARVRGLWTGYVDLTAVQRENAELKQELQTQQVRMQEVRALAQQTESLRQLLELRQRAGVETIASEVIGAGAATDVRAYTIDKGSSDGVLKDMAVISPAGVVGRVILASGRAAQVQLLIDRNAAAAALIERTRAQGIVLGQGGDTLVMEYVPGTADVKQGDLVVTSGIDAVYPKGFVVGTVEVVERGPGTFHQIAVRPAVDFSRLEEVLVVSTPPDVKAAEAAEAKIQAARPRLGQQPPTNQTPATARPGNQTPATARAGNQTPRRPGNQTPRPVPRPAATAEPEPGNTTPPSTQIDMRPSPAAPPPAPTTTTIPVPPTTTTTPGNRTPRGPLA
jgi:rod shape-determining protein MreC